jgi:SAM-dependent methyltransferase
MSTAKRPRKISAEKRRLLRESMPIPPLDMRKLVGPIEPEAFDNPTGELVYPHLSPEQYSTFFDFGCGCGRVARQLLLQELRPDRYVGIDLHRGMIEWCQANLAPHDRGFEFLHHDVFNLSFNPTEGQPKTAPFPVGDNCFTVANAWSVFTHLTESQAPHYLRETRRILRPDGVLNGTWFLFEKQDFPMLQEYTNALYISEIDPTAAVIYDREWVRQTARDVGLTIVHVVPPAIRGFQWILVMAPIESGKEEAKIPYDEAAFGSLPPPDMPPDAHRIGLEGEAAERL